MAHDRRLRLWPLVAELTERRATSWRSSPTSTALTTPCGGPPAAVLLNGRVRTLADGGRVAEALAVGHDGRILAVGSTAEVRALCGSGTVQHDLAGLAVLPGFYDSHNHMRFAGLDALAIDLSGARTIGDILGAVRTRAARTPPGEWITSSLRWHESQLAEQRYPTRAELDAVAPEHPVLLARGGHNRIANSLAFARAGISRDTPNPPGGTYVRDPSTGELTGHVIGAPAFLRLAGLLPPPTAEQERTALRAVMRAYNAAGITSVMEPGLQPGELAMYQRLWQAGELTVRVTAMPRVYPGTTQPELERALDWVRKLSFSTGFGDDWLQLGGVKVTADGGVEASYLREPFAYTDDPSAPRGKPQVTVETLTAVCAEAARLGWQMGVHCVGDAAIDMVLDAYEAVHVTTSLVGRRWMLIHAMAAYPEHLARARPMGLAVATQQLLMYTLAAGFRRYWGPERTARCVPLRLYRESGLPVGFGSDTPVGTYEPLVGLWSAATRTTQHAGVQGPEWAISLADALDWYTRGSAYLSFDERTKGTLEPGKLADLVALDVDPLEAEPEAVRNARVRLTMVGGRIVHGGA